MLKLIAAINSFLIVGLSIAKLNGWALGIRTGGNTFTGVIAGLDVTTLLLILLVLGELSVLALLIIPKLQVD